MYDTILVNITYWGDYMIFCNYTLYNGKVYETYFDKESLKTRFFSDGLEVDGSVYLELNDKYNRRPDARYKFSGTAKLLVGVVAANIAIASIATGLATDSKTEPVDNPPSYAIEEVDKEDVYNQLYEAAGDNQEFIETMYDPINDFSEYLQVDDLLNTIETLEIVQEEDSVFDNENIVGYYDRYENKIVISPEVSEGYEKDSVLFHEGWHYLSQGGFSIYSDVFDGYIGNGIDEGMTQMLTNEYWMSDNSYAINICYVQALAELVGSDKMKEAYVSDDGLYMLIDEMSNYMSEDDAYSMIKNVDIAVSNHQSYAKTSNEEDLANMESAAQEFWRIYEEAYYDKTGIKVSDDELLTACKTGTTFIDEKYGLDYIRYVEVTKPYFNTKNVGEDDYYSIYYCCEDGNYSMEINETTRFNNNSAKVK